MAQTIGSIDLNAFSDLYSDSIQYFWFEGNASATYGAGVHVTLIPDTSFINNPTGQNILMNTDGFSIRNGLLPMMTLDNDSLDFNAVDTTQGTYVTTATFGLNGSQIGLDDEARMIITPTSTEWYSDENTLAGAIYHSPTEKTETTTTSGTMSGMSYGWWDVPTITIDVVGGTIQLNFSGEITENDRHQDAIGTFDETKTFDFNGYDKNVDGGYYASYSFSVELSSGNSETFYLVIWETGTISIGLREHLPNTVYSMDFWGIMSYTSEVSFVLSRIGEKILFGQSQDDDIIARATNIHNELRVGNYGLVNYDETVTPPLITVGNGTDDEHRANAFTVDQNGNVTVNNHSSPIGSFYLDNVATAALTANIDAYKNGASITLDAGTYVVYCYGSMGTNSSAAQLRAIRLYRVTPNAAGLWSWRNVYPNGNWATISATLPMRLTETTTLRVDASASVAGNGASTWIIAVRIA